MEREKRNKFKALTRTAADSRWREISQVLMTGGQRLWLQERKSNQEAKECSWDLDISCTRLGGICQPVRYICQDRYLKDKCSGAKTRQCCMPGMIEICICPYRNVTITQTSCKLLQMVTNTQLILFFCQEGIKMDLQSFFQVWLMKTLLWEWGCMYG